MPALPDVGPTLGALELGVLVSYLLFGVTTTQVYIYFTRFPEDDWKLKILVAFVWTCEAIHSACVGHTLYVYTISNFGNAGRLVEALPSTFDTAVLVASVITSAVQGFFAYRIYIIGGRRIILPGIFWGISTIRFIGCLGIFVTGVKMTSLPVYEKQIGWLMTSVWAVGSANDIGISISLVYLLSRQRNEIHQRTVPLVDKLIMWTLETGIMTSAWALLTLIFFVVMNHNFVWLAIYITGTRVFSNSLLASLNGRSTLRAISTSSGTIEGPISLTSTGIQIAHSGPNTTTRSFGEDKAQDLGGVV
ncbi:hypothetical protein FB45DRAFT_906369 [Roridomyces roridus]|uniref:DUF6534 domain-containing protein n=1 Tax=Roridomyces roridus TaxID=1738132 RepID=A0AAD7FT74_9AGAR|nr:hypothetical protein FB45DRAFT_906369 [Roridomyces roridus]